MSTSRPPTEVASPRERWEQAGDWPLTAIALIFLAAWSWPVIDPHLPDPWPGICNDVTWFAWAVFVLDYLVRLALTRDTRGFVRSNLLDLAVVVLPVFRPLRVLRLVKLLSVLNRHAGTSLRGRAALYVGLATPLVLFVGSVAVLQSERGAPGSNIESFGEALWWAVVTITTAGYGDHYPVTFAGRVVAVGMMLCGIALLGVVTAYLASWLIQGVVEDEAEEVAQEVAQEAEEAAEAGDALTRQQVQTLIEEVRGLRAELAARDLELGRTRGPDD